MKNSFKRFLALTLAAVLLMGMLPLQALAMEFETVPADLAYVWSTDPRLGYVFADIGYAWSAAVEFGNILLYRDVIADEVLTVPSDATVNVYMDGHSISRKLDSAKDSGQVFLVRENASLNLYGGYDEASSERKTDAKISGGYNKNGGGGIHIQKYAQVGLYGVTVTGNKTTDDHGGGGVRLEKEGGSLIMNDFTYITGNTAEDSNGGGISLHGKSTSVTGGNVENNTAAGHGGGISVHNSSCKIVGVTIKENQTGKGKMGGGIYMAEGCGCSVSGCLIQSNNAVGGRGGGICVDGNGGSLSYSVIQENKAVSGAGIYIDDGDTLSLSGDITVNKNESSEFTKSYANLYLESDDGNHAYISGNPTGGEVRISWNDQQRKGDTVKLSKESGTFNNDYLISDMNGYYVYWSWSTGDGKNDRYLRASKTDYRNEPVYNAQKVAVEDRYTVHENAYLEQYDLQEGIFSYKATAGIDLDAVYYYSDGYFSGKPEVYNPQLSTMSLSLVMSAFNTTGTEFDDGMHNGSYANRFRNAKLLLSDLGFADRNIHISESFTKKPTDTSIGVIMGAKEITLAEESYILVPIAVRGAGYESEWASNVTLGQSGEAAGFSNAADQVMEQWQAFLASDTDFDLQQAAQEGKLKFWVVGFSRAAATANLVAKRLTDQYGKENEIYGYCFEAPKGGVDSAALVEEHTYQGQYLNIHNIINSGDLVPFVGPQEMGFKRYGVDHFIPGDAAGEVKKDVYETPKKVSVTTYADNQADVVNDDDYKARRSAFLHQLAILDNSIVFDDYFSLATMNYVGFAFGTNDMIGPLKNGTKTSAAQWIPVFVKNLCQWASNGTYSLSTKDGDGAKGDYRKFYSTNTEFCGENYVSVETALQYFTKLIFGLDNSEELMDALMFRMNAMAGNTGTMLDFYVNVIQMWKAQAQFRQILYLDDVWEALTTDLKYPNGDKVPPITDFIPAGEQDTFKKATYSLLSFLLLFVAEDYVTALDLEGVDTHQVHLGTLLYNVSGILQCHYPEVCMAWLRTYDSNYSNTGFTYHNTTVDLVSTAANVAAVHASVERIDGNSVITLTAPLGADAGVDTDSADNGSAIYYQLSKNGNPETGWLLYQDPVSIAVSQEDETNIYQLKAYAVRCQQKSDMLILDDDQIKNNAPLVGSLMGEGSVAVVIGLAVILVAAAVITIVSVKKRKELPEPEKVENT